MRRWSRRRENNKIVMEENKNEKRVSKTLCAVLKKDSLPSLIFFDLLFAIILIKGHKVDFLFLFKKRVWFHCEC